MQIRFSHGDAEWPSSTAFHNFRKRLASSLDINLDEMQGFYGTGSWEGLQDPLIPLLTASDVQGRIAWKDASEAAASLSRILETWPTDDPDRVRGQRLVIGLEMAGRTRGNFVCYGRGAAAGMVGSRVGTEYAG